MTDSLPGEAGVTLSHHLRFNQFINLIQLYLGTTSPDNYRNKKLLQPPSFPGQVQGRFMGSKAWSIFWRSLISGMLLHPWKPARSAPAWFFLNLLLVISTKQYNIILGN